MPSDFIAMAGPESDISTAAIAVSLKSLLLSPLYLSLRQDVLPKIFLMLYFTVLSRSPTAVVGNESTRRIPDAPIIIKIFRLLGKLPQACRVQII